MCIYNITGAQCKVWNIDLASRSRACKLYCKDSSSAIFKMSVSIPGKTVFILKWVLWLLPFENVVSILHKDTFHNNSPFPYSLLLSKGAPCLTKVLFSYHNWDRSSSGGSYPKNSEWFPVHRFPPKALENNLSDIDKLTHLPLVTHICISKLCQIWFR